MEGRTTRVQGRRWVPMVEAPLWWPSTLFVALLVGTMLILWSPAFRFNIRSARAEVALEATGIVLAVLVAALAEIRFSVDRNVSYLFLALVFLVMAASRLAFGILLQPRIAPQEGTYVWTGARLLMAVLLLLGALRWPTVEPAVRHPLLTFAVGALVTFAALAAIETPLWLLRHHLAPLPSGAVTEIRLRALSVTDLAMGLVGAAVFLLAAVLYLLPPARPFSRWLPSALVLAAFSHIEYMLMPTVFGSRVSPGDLLRLGFSVVLLVGLIGEMRSSHLAERDRARQLRRAFEVERQRAEELEEAERARAELLGMLTHELLHPVAATRGMVLVLQRRWPDLSDDDKVELVERLDAETAHLVDLAERVPSVARTTEEPFPLLLQERQVGEVIEEAVAIPPEGHPLEVCVGDRVAQRTLLVDPVRILQVFRNLLANAAKFSLPGTPILLDADATGAEVRFSVIDSGIGVPPDEVDRVFDPFTRGRVARSGAVPGSGLGLYVSRRIVEQHGGRIWVEPQRSQGSCFRFTIPSPALGADA